MPAEKNATIPVSNRAARAAIRELGPTVTTATVASLPAVVRTAKYVLVLQLVAQRAKCPAASTVFLKARSAACQVTVMLARRAHLMASALMEAHRALEEVEIPQVVPRVVPREVLVAA